MQPGSNNLAAEYCNPIGGPVIARGIYEASSTPFREVLLPSVRPVWSFTGPRKSRLCVSVRLSAEIKSSFVHSALCQPWNFLPTLACNLAFYIFLCGFVYACGVWAFVSAIHCLHCREMSVVSFSLQVALKLKSRADARFDHLVWRVPIMLIMHHSANNSTYNPH